MPEVIYSLAGKKVYVAGHRGMVGSAIMRRLASEGCEILTATRAEVDLRRQEQVEAWMDKTAPTLSSWPPQGSAVFSRTLPIRPISYTTTWSSKRTSSTQLIELTSKS